ncbi:MAG: alpha/beta hydrolase-fold protein [Cyclobacteriaceae bacterium]|nr:alpha/beta hydrolase-fold protein [Cyclobacteriaceae bacterium]
MATVVRLTLFLFLIVGCVSKSQKRIDTFILQSEIFDNNRTIRVYLPPSYDGIKTFKVLYLNDGQNLFGDNEIGAVNEWRLDEIMDSLWKETDLEPLIVVGIDHAGKGRGNEYLPWPDEYLHPPIPQPEGSKYPHFLMEEVMPAIETKYQVQKGKHHTGIGGASYGGLISLYTLVSNPETFGFALIESPSLYVNDQSILTLVKEQGGSWPTRIYLGIGTNELGLEHCGLNNPDNQMAVEDVDSLYNLVRQQTPATKCLKFVDSCAVHSELAWSRRLPQALQFLLGD